MPAATKAIDVAGHVVGHNAKTVAGVVYHMKDKRFTRWGKYSKVLVPEAAAGIKLWSERLSVFGMAWANAELLHSFGDCSKKLQ